MKKRAQAMLLGVMFFVFAFIMAVVLSQPLREQIDIMRDADHLNCTQDNITTGVALTCVAVDLTLPFFLMTVIVAGTGLIFTKAGGV